MSLLACGDSRWLEDGKDVLEDLEKAGSKGKGPEEDDAEVEVLVEFSHASKLTDLDLRDSNLTDKSAIAIANSEGFKGLFSLNLSGNRITDIGAKALAGSKNFGQLRKI